MIVSWNCVDALRRCLTALRAPSTGLEVEVLVVDAGSHDGSGQIEAEFPGITFQRMPRNFGETRARNIAMRTSHAELILLLSPDAELHPATIPALIAALESDDHAVGAVPKLVDAAGHALPLGCKLPDRKALAAACRENRELALDEFGPRLEYANDAVLLLRKSFLRGINFLDEKRYSEFWSELDLCLQIRSVGKRIVVADAPATLHAAQRSIDVPDSEQALLAADRIAGAAAFVNKRDGFGAMLGFLLGQLGSALAGLFRRPGHAIRLIVGILSGSRIDGTQGGVLG